MGLGQLRGLVAHGLEGVAAFDECGSLGQQPLQLDGAHLGAVTPGLPQVMVFAQLSEARGLRDIPAMLASQDARRYHSGLPQVARSTLADALALRPCAAVSIELLHSLIPQVTQKLARGIGDCVRLIDSTTVQLTSLSAGWVRFLAKFCGAKAHVVFDPDANCPLYLAMTPANVNDITAAKAMPVDAGATYVFDLGYYDYGWWAKLDARAAASSPGRRSTRRCA